MAGFIGRVQQLETLRRQFRRVARPVDEPGRCVIVRGRRRVGKSRLIEEFIRASQVPAVFFTASRQGSARELQLFADEVGRSTLPGAALFSDVRVESWDAALRLLAEAVGNQPAVVVVDELPYLLDDEPSFDATLQKHWDRSLSKRPLLLVLVGSDLSVMHRLNDYGRPFHQRGTTLLVPPFTPAETADMLGLAAADAFDAHLVTGGLPLVLEEWREGATVFEFLHEALSDPTSALIVSGERSLAAEFPSDVQAARVLRAIGSGERTFTGVSHALGDVQGAPLSRALALLREKRVVADDLPVSTAPSRERRYRVEDPYLRFWLRFIGPHLAEIERGRADIVVDRITTAWSSWRGRAVEPLVRESIERMLPGERFGLARHVGGYWTRTNTPEVDLVGVDRHPVATTVAFVGSVRWRDSRPLDDADIAQLVRDRALVPGADDRTPMVGVSRTGFTTTGLSVALTAEDLLDAWRAEPPRAD